MAAQGKLRANLAEQQALVDLDDAAARAESENRLKAVESNLKRLREARPGALRRR